MKKLLLLTFMAIAIQTQAQNVGIGNPAPAEKLDVTGNINVTGTIKANGVDGTANQVLMKNNAGNLTWGNICDYKNIVNFNTPGNGNWTVPAGVTKVLVEVWGAGGGGNIFAGGGGGGYIMAILDVIPSSSIGYTIGTKGTGQTFAATHGGNSNLSIGLSVFVQASGGLGAVWDATSGLQGSSGGSFTTSGYLNYFGKSGEQGKILMSRFTQGTTTLFEIVSDGNGGNAGNTDYTYGNSAEAIFNATGSAIVRRSLARPGRLPGGGGGAGYSFLSSVVDFGNGADGANGMILIHY